MKLLLRTCVLLAGFTLMLASSAKAAGLSAGIGALDYHVARYGTNASGKSSLFARVYPTLRIASGFHVGSFLKFEPQLDYTFLGKKNADQETSRILILSTPFSADLFGGLFDLKFGPGMLWYSISGPQDYPAVITIPNGTSTASASLPDRGMTSRVLLLNLGVSKSIGSWRGDFDTFIESALSSRRSVSIALNISYSLISNSSRGR